MIEPTENGKTELSSKHCDNEDDFSHGCSSKGELIEILSNLQYEVPTLKDTKNQVTESEWRIFTEL